MEIYSQLLLIYLVLINLVSIIVTISDKVKAIKRKWRIPESTLLLLSALGGSVSMYITMLIIRHKTKIYDWYSCNFCTSMYFSISDMEIYLCLIS
jgi:uncharacterized membrane protein YsdA (DUF1294 family)